MTILPLVERELRVAVRRPHAYRVRMAVATVAMVIAVWGLWVWSNWIAGSFVGHSLFRVLAIIAFSACLSAGVLLTADGISQERREGTLGLLFLTDLQPADIIFGKLTAKAVLPLYALLALVPAMAVFTIFGGVTGGELLRTLLALGNTLFVSLAIALSTSVFCVEQRLAHGFAVLAMALLAGGSVAMQTFAPALSAGTFNAVVASLSLTTTISYADERTFQSARPLFFAALGSTHLLAWLALVLTCQLVPRAWREGELKVWHLTRRRSTVGLKFCAPQTHKRILDDNPITWLGNRDAFRANVVWTLPLTALLIWCGLSLISGIRARLIAMLLCATAVHIAIRFWIAMDASHAFGTGRRNGTLESLLGTPLSPHEIGAGMIQALRQRFFWPGLTIAIMSVVAAGQLSMKGAGAPALALFVVAITLMLDISCISWVGLWNGLAASGATTAIVSTLAKVLVLPLAWLALLRGPFNQSSAAEFVGMYFVVALVNNLLFRASARTRLQEYFRKLALRPYGAKIPHMESKWSPINWEEELRETEESIVDA